MPSVALSAVSVVMGLIAILGLYIAAGAKDAMFAFFGWGLIVFAIVFVVALINRYVGAAPEA